MTEFLGRCEWRKPEADGRRCLAAGLRREDGKVYCDLHPGSAPATLQEAMERAGRNRDRRLLTQKASGG